MKTEMVTITQQEYDDLIKDQRILNALYEGGVDKWMWYDESLAHLREDEDS